MWKRFKITSVMMAIAASSVFLQAEESIVIVKDGKSSFQIIVPDNYPDKQTGGFIMKAAELLRNCIRAASGAELPVVSEGNSDKDKSGIYLGNTGFAQANKIKPETFTGWNCVCIAVGKNIILAGNDRPGVPNPTKTAYTSYCLGTVKAVTTFIEQQMGGKFILPGPNGINVPENRTLTVPGNLDMKIKPPMEYCTSRNAEMFYDIANNFFSNSEYFVYGGHSYYEAVPKAKFAKTHPEYFAMSGSGGERNTAADHLCISNPEVQELMYAEMLKRLDAGYKVVELGQTDGYSACKCDNCKKLFNVADDGEKLWILHRNLAERVLKDRPDKKVQIISYGPTKNPPETFKKFPENVIVQLCTYSPESFERWRGCKVPGGFVVYVYNWGNYSALGLTPKRNPKFCEEQIKLFVANNVKGIYRCGFGELFGLEGPQYYVYGQMLNNPDGTGDKFADDFYRAAYGNAYHPMKSFYETMHRRLEENNSPTFSRNPRVALAYFYSPDVLDVMEQSLSRAEKVASDPKVKARLKLARQEFNYVKGLAGVIHLYNAYRINKTWANLDQLGEAMELRKKKIANLYDDQGNMKLFEEWTDVKPFFLAKKDFLEYNSQRFRGAPFTWDIERLKKCKVLPGANVKSILVAKAPAPVEMDGDLNKGAWKDVEFQNINEIQMGKLHKETKFKMLYDQENLYAGIAAEINPGQKFTPMGRDGASFREDCVEILLDPWGNREKYYHFICNPLENSFYDSAVAFITDPLDPRFGKADKSWDGDWEYKNFIKDGVWTAIVKIPFKTLGVQCPAKGDLWCGNIARTHYLDDKGAHEYSLWSPNLETLSFHEKDTFGEFKFE